MRYTLSEKIPLFHSISEGNGYLYTFIYLLFMHWISTPPSYPERDAQGGLQKEDTINLKHTM